MESLHSLQMLGSSKDGTHYMNISRTSKLSLCRDGCTAFFLSLHSQQAFFDGSGESRCESDLDEEKGVMTDSS